MYFLSSLSSRTAKTLINLHKKWGFRRFQKERQTCAKPHFLRTFYTLFAQKVRFCALLCAERAPNVRKTALFAHFLHTFCTKNAVLRTFCAQKERQTCAKPHFLHTFCTKSAVLRTFCALFLESAATPLFVQINVFAVRALRLDRRYTQF